MVLWQYISDFVSLFFPQLCLGCRRTLVFQEEYLCTHCYYSLPYTYFHLDRDNQAAKSLWGRVPTEAVASCFYFTYGSPMQQILHSIKYRNRPKAAQFFGRLYGEELKDAETFKDATLIVPVPLHRKRLRQRGYNQSEYFGKGLSESMGIKMRSSALKRIRHRKSQTTKSRYERYENTEGIFKVVRPKDIANQHIILVDDVLTTGSTLEACADVLLEVKGVRISIITLAFAK
jgi:ComF family protein